MRLLVTGVNGQLGAAVVNELICRNIEAVPCSKKEFDITNEKATMEYIRNSHCDGVIHCAAYTAVDKAEDETEKCTAVNIYGTENIAKECARENIKLIYISTDYVYSGEGEIPFEVTDKVNPKNFYGTTKYFGEEKVREYCKKYFIVRTSWVFGENGNNFVNTMMRLSKEKEELSVVCDQIGSPTYTKDLAVLLCDMAVTEKYGTYNASNEGFCSWAEFAQEIFRLSKVETKVKFISSNEYRSRAIRPLNSRLSKKSIILNGFELLPLWQDAVKRYLADIK